MLIMIDPRVFASRVMRIQVFFYVLFAFAFSVAAEVQENRVLEEILVTGKTDSTSLRSISGSATILSEIELEAFDYADLGKLLSQVPGVYVRGEDGYGLRPNIGIRGAAAERSQKITLMKDGVLITPAPYSAPAAYYVPNLSRISSVEILKGSAAVKYGPHTVGGAVNLISAPIPSERLSRLDLSAGSFGERKVQAMTSNSNAGWSYLLDIMSYGSSGFKRLDGGGDTGFERSDIGAKFSYVPMEAGGEQIFTLSIDAGNEEADETYLGLTDYDFTINPDRRYRASKLDRFESNHASIIGNFGSALSDKSRLNLKAYATQFERSWNKLDGFENGPALQEVLQSPNLYSKEYFILTGDFNSGESPGELLDITNNDRQFFTSGIQASLQHRRDLESFIIDAKLGVRWHHDRVTRLHSPISYQMLDTELVIFDTTRLPKTRNRAETDALAVFLSVGVSSGDWNLEVGGRYENIDGAISNLLDNSQAASVQSVFSPSVSLTWNPDKDFMIFVGGHVGFSPAGPGSSEAAEESENLELGLKWVDEAFESELIFFRSDYENLLGRCRVSDANCSPGEEFNGGEVLIQGAEFLARKRMELLWEANLEATVNYTYTNTEFKTSFLSGYNAWGLVKTGDELPYIPQHIGNAMISVTRGSWSVNTSVRFQERMREQAGASPIVRELHSDAFAILDASVHYQMSSSTQIQLIFKNVTNESPIVSHRPFGARPEHPQSLIARFIYEI